MHTSSFAQLNGTANADRTEPAGLHEVFDLPDLLCGVSSSCGWVANPVNDCATVPPAGTRVIIGHEGAEVQAWR